MPAPNSCSSSAPGDPIPGAVSVGQLSDGSVNFLVTFSNRNAGQLQSLINSGKIISEEQFEANYAPTQTDYDQVASFLTENNITVTQTWANRLLLAGSGEASDVERAFNAEIDLFQH
ncbi:MAG TPA: protease pro-enzyme activation domain-containing protein, partial [archaeon]|nr:protease pro-enzyme activation domain-containing protein [archaeon]